MQGNNTETARRFGFRIRFLPLPSPAESADNYTVSKVEARLQSASQLEQGYTFPRLEDFLQLYKGAARQALDSQKQYRDQGRARLLRYDQIMSQPWLQRDLCPASRQMSTKILRLKHLEYCARYVDHLHANEFEFLELADPGKKQAEILEYWSEIMAGEELRVSCCKLVRPVEGEVADAVRFTTQHLGIVTIHFYWVLAHFLERKTVSHLKIDKVICHSCCDDGFTLHMILLGMRGSCAWCCIQRQKIV